MALPRYPRLEAVAEQGENRPPTSTEEVLDTIQPEISTQKIQEMAEKLRKLAFEIEQTTPKVSKRGAKESWAADDIELIAKRALIS